MIDFHSHILPNMDDGSSGIEESLELLRISKNQGIQAIVATPHFYAADENPSSFLARREKSINLLKKEISDKSDYPEIILGAEVGYFEGISDCSEISKLKIEGTSLLLVEMPMCKWNARMIDEIGAIYEKNGIVPLIAHIDRYITMLRSKHLADMFNDMPVIIQANGSFFTNKKTVRLASKLLKNKKIHLLGSDCHNTSHRRPNLDDAFAIITERLGDGAIKRILQIEKQVFVNDAVELEELFI